MKKNEKNIQKIKEQKYRTRIYSIKEGIFASAKQSFGDRFIPPFAIAINLSSSSVALLSSISGLLGPLSQTFGSKLIEKYPRKKILLKSVFFESLTLLPLIILSILFYKRILTGMISFLLLFSFSLYIAIANIGYPAWFSWMGDVVNEKYRGRWFSKRNLITGFVAIILAVSASFFLDYTKKKNLIMLGFAVLFSLASVSRLICWKTLKKQYEPKIKLKKSDYFSFWDFIIKAPKNNFGKFAIFRALLSFSGSISSPLVVVYLLRNLKFNYATYMIIILSGTVFSLAVLELWGKFADKYGNYKVLDITNILIPIIPILWILSPSPVYLILVPSLISGISWAGFNLSASNFVYDSVSPQKRGMAISYYNMLNGIGIFLGAGLGALLIKFLTISFIEPILMIFFIGSIARMMVVSFWLPKLKEIRKTKKFSGLKAFKEIILKKANPTFHEEAHEIIHIKKYLTLK